MPRTTREWVAEDRPASKIPSYPVLSGRWPRPLSASPPSPFFRWQRQKSGLKMRLNKNSVDWIKTVVRRRHEQSCPCQMTPPCSMQQHCHWSRSTTMQKFRTSCNLVQDDSLANERPRFALLSNCISRASASLVDTSACLATAHIGR